MRKINKIEERQNRIMLEILNQCRKSLVSIKRDVIKDISTIEDVKLSFVQLLEITFTIALDNFDIGLDFIKKTFKLDSIKENKNLKGVYENE